MTEVADTIERDVLRAEIYYDQDPSNPREDWDGALGVMWTEVRHYSFGGERDHDTVPDFEIECSRCEGTGDDPERFEVYRGYRSVATVVGAGSEAAMHGEAERDPTLSVDAAACSLCKGEGHREVDPVTYFKVEHGARVVLAIDAYIHSGVSIKAVDVTSRGFSDPWDSGRAGFICDTAESRERCGANDWTDEQIREALAGEVREYDRYLTGDVYGFEIKVGDNVFGDYGYWGLIGSEYAKAEAKSALDHALVELEQRREAHAIRGEN